MTIEIAAHYDKFPYPTPFNFYARPKDPLFWHRFLHQNVGLEFLGKEPKIWVAGCGTRLALQTALAFPTARVLGTDISERALEICSADAKAVGCTNLVLEKMDLERPGGRMLRHQSSFDFIQCVGVLHHLKDPHAGMWALYDALKPHGVIELMVYNKAHHAWNEGVQQFMRRLGATNLNTVKQLLKGGFHATQEVDHYLGELRELPAVELADVLLNPLQRSYTFGELVELCSYHSLKLLQPVATPAPTYRPWWMRFTDVELQKRYDELPQLQRWETSADLMGYAGPLFHFYVGKEELYAPTEKDLCADFVAAVVEGRAKPTPPVKIDAWRRQDGKLVYQGEQEFRVRGEASSLLVGPEYLKTLAPWALNDFRMRSTTMSFPHLVLE